MVRNVGPTRVGLRVCGPGGLNADIAALRGIRNLILFINQFIKMSEENNVPFRPGISPLVHVVESFYI